MDEWYVQFNAIGQNPQMWVYQAVILKRTAAILKQVARAGSDRMMDLLNQEPAPPPGEVRRSDATAEMTSAMLDTQQWGVSSWMIAAAIECLIKARALQQGKTVIDEQGRMVGRFQTHQLRALAGLAGIELSPKEMDLLEMLTPYLLWRGRYPIPKSWNSYYKPPDRESNISVGELQDRAFALYDKLVNIITDQPS